MLPAIRHFADAPDTPFCSIWEADGAVGGGAVLWSLVHACTTPQTSLIVLPQLLGATKLCSPEVEKIIGNPTTVFLKDDGDAQFGIQQALDMVRERHPDNTHRLVILECASTLSMLQGFDVLTNLLVYLSLCPHVHGVVALLRQDVHSQEEVNRIHRLSSCTFSMQPARPLPSDYVHAKRARLVHVETVISLLRHSGRVRIDMARYSMLASGCMSLPVIGTQDTTEISDGKYACENWEQPSEQLQSKFERNMSGFMKLTLSALDRQQRETVVLPWQHQGRSSVSSRNQHGNEMRGLVHYMRDSDQDCDSDEDPDDDLDL
eukprot:jgi/Ulvmu1/5141/UM021_0158.1